MGQRSELKREGVSAKKRRIGVIPYMLFDLPSSTLASVKKLLSKSVSSKSSG